MHHLEDAFSINPEGCTSIPHILNERSGCLYWEVTYILDLTIHFSPKYKLAGPSFSEFPSSYHQCSQYDNVVLDRGDGSGIFRVIKAGLLRFWSTAQASKTSDICCKVIQWRYRFDDNLASKMLRSEFGILLWYHGGMRTRKLGIRIL